jgi:hypothetical protein
MPSWCVYHAVTLQRAISLSYHVRIFYSPWEDNINVNLKGTGHDGVDRIQIKTGITDGSCERGNEFSGSIKFR